MRDSRKFTKLKYIYKNYFKRVNPNKFQTKMINILDTVQKYVEISQFLNNNNRNHVYFAIQFIL